MREIKFRAWDSEHKVMKRPSVNMMIDTFSATCYWMFGYVIEIMGKLELMQFTGLKDKNGKEIYEGDILRKPDGGCNRVVKYRPCYFYLTHKKENEWEGILDEERIRLYHYEIIGNIYEHQELLTQPPDR